MGIQKKQTKMIEFVRLYIYYISYYYYGIHFSLGVVDLYLWNQ